ncbi:MAG: S-layer homology domain-containing protein, partial [Evtepia sp.]|nr:S-layer homology domain-containing protein [Evtepia sp.]
VMLSVMVVGAGAAFSDQSKIKNTEAVDMCVVLGIIDGYGDGNYYPEKNLTRAEATKLIAVMLNGGKDAVQANTSSSYVDVKTDADSSWAEKYIEFCTAKGIVCGVGSSRFEPSRSLTGTELAKMLLVSLGYDSVKEGYEIGSGWDLNVNTDAVTAGLYKDLEATDMAAALTRDDAAQMIWNALNAKQVKYLTNISDVQATKNTLLGSVFKASVETGILTAIDYNRDTKEYTYTVGEKDYVTTADYTDLFAMTVSVLAKGDDALGIRVDKGGVVVSGAIGDIEGIANDHFNTITVDGVKYRLDNVAKDADALWDITVAYNDYTGKYFDGDVKVQYAFSAIDQDGGGDIDKIVVYPYVVLATDYVKTDSFRTHIITPDDANLTVKANTQDSRIAASLGLRAGVSFNTVEFDDVQVNGTVVNDGYVKAIPAQFTAQGEDIYTALGMQSATVTKAASKDLLISLDGTQYDGSLLEQITAFKQISVNKDYGYIEVNGYLFIMDGTGIVPALDQYAVVTSVANASSDTSHTWKTDLLLTSGETVTVNVSAVDSLTKAKATVGSLYTYEVNDDGNYELTAVVNDPAPQDSEFDIQQAYKDGATLNEGNNNDGVSNMFGENTKGIYFLTQDKSEQLNIEDDAVIFAYIDRDPNNTGYDIDTRSSEYVVLKGSDLDGLSSNEVNWAFTGATVKTSNVATVDLGYIRLAADPTDSTVYGYVVADSARTYDDGHYVYVDVLTDTSGTAVQYQTSKTVIQNKTLLQKLYENLKEGGVFELLLDKNGDLVGVVDETTETATVTGLYDGVLLLNNESTRYALTEDTVIINAGNAKDELQVGDAITFIADGDELELVVYGIDYYVPGDVTIGSGIDATICVAEVSRSGDNVTVSMTKTDSATWNDQGNQFTLTVSYDTGKTVSVPGVRSNDNKAINFTFTAEANVASLSVVHN